MEPARALCYAGRMLTSILAAAMWTSAAAPRLSGWTVPWDKTPDLSASCLSEIHPFAYALGPDGSVVWLDAGLVERAARSRPAGALVIPVVVNDVVSGGKVQELKSIGMLERLLADPKRRAAHVRELAALAEGVDGLEIDYERIPPGLWGPFVEFLKELSADLRPRGKRLHVDLEGGLLKRWGRPGVVFWPEVAAAVDQINLMAYYERGAWAGVPDGAGPGASVGWVREIIAAALEVIPAEKLTVALSLAATDWQLPLARAPGKRKLDRLHYRQVRALLEKLKPSVERDETLGSPRFRYEKDGRQREVWFEDERSLRARILAANELGVKQVGLWYLGSEHPDLDALCSGPAGLGR